MADRAPPAALPARRCARRRSGAGLSSELTGAATWEDPAWRATALEWAAAELERRGLAVHGEPEQPRVRAWSTVFRLPTSAGAMWLKAVGAGSAQEPPLSAALAEWVPGRVLEPLAVDVPRRLILLPDGGRTLRDSGASTRARAWEAMLLDYAQLQVDLAPHVDEMLGMGVPDARPQQLPEQAAALLRDDDAMLLDRPEGLPGAERDRIAGDFDTYAECCSRLAEGGIPSSLQHDDLHDGNVFAGPGSSRFFDWGDATVSHPFLSLLVTLRMAGRALGLPAGDPGLVRLRDAYLEPWTAFGSPAQLRELCALALRIGPPARALSWRRILLGIHPAERAEWDGAVPGWMAEYLEPGPLHRSGSVGQWRLSACPPATTRPLTSR